MKLKNAPGRKQERREVAYRALVERWLGRKMPTVVKNEYDALKERLSLGNLRHVRTKKNRAV